MTPELQGAGEAVRPISWRQSKGRFTANISLDQHNAFRALLASHATLTAENEKLRGKVGELEAKIADVEKHFPELIGGLAGSLGREHGIAGHFQKRAEAAEAQLATARRALEPFAFVYETRSIDEYSMTHSADYRHFQAAAAFLKASTPIPTVNGTDEPPNAIGMDDAKAQEIITRWQAGEVVDGKQYGFDTLVKIALREAGDVIIEATSPSASPSESL